MHRKYYILHLLMACVLTACTPAVREAKSVVAQADSLWHAGVPCGDSIALAQAFTTLDTYQYLYPDDYAHACYHYGRLLREKENPVEAMQVFIHATHSHTRDYHILGRVYSNMGDIAHLAGEFSLAYDMYEHSTDFFLRNGDSSLYYYGLYRMAYELAERGEKDSCFAITENIKSRNPTDSTLVAYSNMSQAQACLKCKQYDSVLFYAFQSQRCLQSVPSVILQLAQAYSLLGVKDSAVLYAKQVLASSCALSDINNALYILTNDVPENQDVRSVASDRSDIQKQIEIRHGKMTQAVQLLSQELSRKPDLRWLYSIIVTIVIIGVCLTIYVYRKYQKKQLLAQKIEVLEHTATTMRKNNDNLKEQQDRRYTERLKQIQSNCKWFTKSNDIQNLLQKGNYNKVCELVNIHFSMLADKLKINGKLNEKDVCLCIYVMDGSFTDKQIADILYYSHNTIRSIKRYVAKKMGTTSANLQSFLLKIAIE